MAKYTLTYYMIGTKQFNKKSSVLKFLDKTGVTFVSCCKKNKGFYEMDNPMDFTWYIKENDFNKMREMK